MVVAQEVALVEAVVQEADLEVAVARAKAWDLVSEAALERVTAVTPMEGVDWAKELAVMEALIEDRARVLARTVACMEVVEWARALALVVALVETVE